MCDTLYFRDERKFRDYVIKCLYFPDKKIDVQNCEWQSKT